MQKALPGVGHTTFKHMLTGLGNSNLIDNAHIVKTTKTLCVGKSPCRMGHTVHFNTPPPFYLSRLPQVSLSWPSTFTNFHQI